MEDEGFCRIKLIFLRFSGTVFAARRQVIVPFQKCVKMGYMVHSDCIGDLFRGAVGVNNQFFDPGDPQF